MDSIIIRADSPMHYGGLQVGLHLLHSIPLQVAPGEVRMTATSYYDDKFQLHPIERGVCRPGPTIWLAKHNAQVLADDLWACGIRPSEGSGSAGALAATQSHLNDLRTLLFHQTGISKSP